MPKFHSKKGETETYQNFNKSDLNPNSPAKTLNGSAQLKSTRTLQDEIRASKTFKKTCQNRGQDGFQTNEYITSDDESFN